MFLPSLCVCMCCSDVFYLEEAQAGGFWNPGCVQTWKASKVQRQLWARTCKCPVQAKSSKPLRKRVGGIKGAEGIDLGSTCFLPPSKAVNKTLQELLGWDGTTDIKVAMCDSLCQRQTEKNNNPQNIVVSEKVCWLRMSLTITTSLKWAGCLGLILNCIVVISAPQKSLWPSIRDG